MLRKSQFKYGLGFITNPFVSPFEKKLRVKKIEPRIHFALNCGAVSCPAIRFYSLDCYEADFDLAARSFLDQTTYYNCHENNATVTPLFSWFRGDFGGIKGIKKMLVNYGYIPNLNVNLKFSKYDWSKSFDNFAS